MNNIDDVKEFMIVKGKSIEGGEIKFGTIVSIDKYSNTVYVQVIDHVDKESGNPYYKRVECRIEDIEKI